MASEKEDILQANAGGPEANIPDLKKKEKERKKAGAAWSGARGAAGEFSGATGGNAARAAASAAGALGEGAGLVGAESGGFLAGIARFLAGLAESLGMGEFWAAVTSTLLGKLAVAAAAFLLVAAAGILGYGLLKGKGGPGLGSPDLGGIADSMRVRAGGDDRMGVNSKGEIRFDPLSAPKAPAAPAPTDAKAADEKPAPDADARKPMSADLLAHNMSGSKLSSSLGGDFGNKNIFAGNSVAPKFGGGPALSKIGGVKGKLSAMKGTPSHAILSPRSVKKGSSNKAFGQLRLAKGLSQQGAAASSAEQAATTSQGAFDQQQPVGQGLDTHNFPGDTPPTMGGTPPDTSLNPNVPTTPGTGTDPGLQNALQQISDLANKAMQDMKMGMMEIVIGIALIAAGLAFLPWGLALVLVGMGLVVMGGMLVMKAQQEQAQAKAMGQQLADNIDNMQQGDSVKACTDWAVQSGQPVSACPASVSDPKGKEHDAQDKADIDKAKKTSDSKMNLN